ncbi:MAG: alpha/beta hydrolase [Bacteroidetes bacterium]|nr:alpha/beta hydrolase [Bacteroidota bacterium]
MKSITLIFSVLLSFIQPAISQDNTKPFVLGVIDEIQSTELNEKRTLNIYLPEGYSKNDTTKYPVIYLLDGSADEDFIHVVGLVQFDNFEWINRVPKCIVVGIATVDRRRDFTFPSTVESERKNYPTTGHSDKFISFLEKELQPFIEKKYHANSSKTIISQSLGGLLLSEILLKKPELFNKYIVISPSLWWDKASILNQSFAALKAISKSTDIYIAVGKEGLTPTDPPRVMEVDANLLEEKFRMLKNSELRITLDYLPGEDHATISHQALYNAFLVVFKN